MPEFSMQQYQWVRDFITSFEMVPRIVATYHENEHWGYLDNFHDAGPEGYAEAALFWMMAPNTVRRARLQKQYGFLLRPQSYKTQIYHDAVVSHMRVMGYTADINSLFWERTDRFGESKMWKAWALLHQGCGSPTPLFVRTIMIEFYSRWSSKPDTARCDHLILTDSCFLCGKTAAEIWTRPVLVLKQNNDPYAKWTRGDLRGTRQKAVKVYDAAVRESSKRNDPLYKQLVEIDRALAKKP